MSGRKWIIGWLLLTALAVGAHAENGESTHPATPPLPEPDVQVEGEVPPINIKADNLNANEKEAVFEGSVVVVRGDARLTCNQLTATYKADSQELDRIVATGDVVITQADRRATGERAVYYRAEDRAILTGNPRLEQGENRFRGKKIEIFFQQKLFKGEEVELIFTPDSVKDEETLPFLEGEEEAPAEDKGEDAAPEEDAAP